MLVTISGPEKAGKSTLCRVFAEEAAATIRHWGPIQSDTEFLVGLQEDVDRLRHNPDEVIVWDRSFVCDHVYSLLLGRDHRFGADPWLAEWLYGRAVQTLGLRVILAGPSTAVLATRRDDSDLPVDPVVEQAAYVEYGRSFGYDVHFTDPDEDDALLMDCLLYRANRNIALPPYVRGLHPPTYAGPVHAAGVVVVDDTSSGLPGSWLPGTSSHVIEYARSLGPLAFSLGWMRAQAFSHSKLRQAAIVYALGQDVARYLDKFMPNGYVFVPLPAERTVLRERAS